MGIFNSILSKGSMGIGAAGGLYKHGVAKFGRANMGTLAGAGLGAIYGGTLGRDPGQSVLGGAFTGALGGAALGRYGRTAARGASRGFMRGGAEATGMLGRMKYAAQGAGRAGWAAARGDARRAQKFLGARLSANAGNGFSGLAAARSPRPAIPSSVAMRPNPVDFGASRVRETFNQDLANRVLEMRRMRGQSFAGEGVGAVRTRRPGPINFNVLK